MSRTVKLIGFLLLALIFAACGGGGGGGTKGELAVTITGLPASTNANVTVTGPNNYTKSLTASETLKDLEAGTYTVTAATVTASDGSYAPNQASQTANVTAGGKAAVTVTYAKSTATGTLRITVNAPAGVTPSVAVTGPGGFSQTITTTGDTTINNATIGTYTITPAGVRASDPIVGTLISAPPSTANVEPNQTATATVNYVARAGSGQLWIPFGNSAGGYIPAQLAADNSDPASTIIGGVNSANAVAFDAAGNLWVTTGSDQNVAGVIYRFSAASLASSGSPSPDLTLTSTVIGQLQGLAFDSSGSLWVAAFRDSSDNTKPPSILRYDNPGSLSGTQNTAPALVIRTTDDLFQLDGVKGLAFDKDGNLWAAISNRSAVVRFDKAAISGTTSPTTASKVLDLKSPTDNCAGFCSPGGIAFDSSGNLWVANSAVPNIFKYNASDLSATSPAPAAIISRPTSFGGKDLGAPQGMAFDASGNLWVADAGDGGKLLKFANVASINGPQTRTADVKVDVPGISFGGIAFNPPPAGLLPLYP